MKKRLVLLSLSYFIFSFTCIIFCDGVAPLELTYFRGGGRFGDQIVAYALTKWASLKSGAQLLLQPFTYSDGLRLHQVEAHYKHGNRETIQVRSLPDILALIETGRSEFDSIICELRREYFSIDQDNNFEHIMQHMLEDSAFMVQLRSMLQPVKAFQKIRLPQDMVTVAVHIRKGGGFDPPLISDQYYTTVGDELTVLPDVYAADIIWPDKFPPEQYYVNQIKRLSKLFHDSPLFVYIFTDDRNPLALLERIKKVVGKDNIMFLCRKKGNRHNANVVEDFFNMARFDCLIRSCSSFARAANLLGDFKVVIYPEHWKWCGTKLVVDEVAITA